MVYLYHKNKEMIKTNCFICEHYENGCSLELDTDGEFEQSDEQLCCTPDFNKVLDRDPNIKNQYLGDKQFGKLTRSNSKIPSYQMFERIYLNKH